MDLAQSYKPLKLNMDKSPKALSRDEMYYALNHDIFLNHNGQKKGTLGKASPMAANYPACDMEMPGGEVYSVGRYYSKLTNELYSWVYNSHGIHFIQRINGEGVCQVVYHGCLTLSADPAHEIMPFRAYLLLEKACANRHGKYLVWVDGNNDDIGYIDVEASIATSYFTTPFFERCAESCDFIRLCVPTPCGCIKGEFVTPTAEDQGKSNGITDVGLKFSYQLVYYDNRAGIWADPSTLFFQDTKGCFDNPTGAARCIKLRIPVGGPMVEKINIGFYKNGNWYLYDTVEKYKKYNSTEAYWYERGLAELTNYSDTDCSFDYIFCGDKQCQPIDPNDFNRVFNPIPRKAQALFPIGLSNQEDTALGVLNYIAGNCPIDQTEIEKVDVTLSCPTDNCDINYTKITVNALVHNTVHERNQPIYRLGGNAANAPDDPADIAYFGGLNQVGSGDLELGYGQQFSGAIRNFIGYIDATNYFDEAKQFKADPGFLNKEEWGVLGHFDDGSENRRWRRAIANGQYFYQKFEFTVPRGTRGFIRLASHHATGNEQDTSTTVIGVLADIATYRGDRTIDASNTDLKAREIYFDTCGLQTLDIKQAFIIGDVAIDAGLSTKASAYSGYVKDANGLPVEGAVVKYSSLQVPTDHNGFYALAIYPGVSGTISVDLLVERDCGAFANVQSTSITGDTGSTTSQDINITNLPYSNDMYAVVKAKAIDCDGQGVAGVRVSLSGSKYRTTGVDGIALFKIRNYQTRDRSVRAVLLDNGGCFEVDCSGNCAPCMPTVTSVTPNCYQTKPEIFLTPFTMNLDSAVHNRGLKANGRYPWGFVVKGRCGKISAVNHIKYLDVPSTQAKGSQSFCTLGWTAPGLVLPDWADCVDLVRGENMKPYELQWVIDGITRTSDGKIKLTIQSLNDYNEQYFFKTNTIYQWLKGDRIEFIRNGDGNIFSIGTYGLLNYLTLSPFNDEQISGETEQADFFNQLLILDDGKLGGLKVGAVIEIQRAKECTTEPAYYGICVSIPVIDGRLAYESGSFTTFDTYFVNRKIGSLPLQKFEHHNPSDFVGDNINPLNDQGRAYFINKYENEKRFGRNISINAPNEFNRFGDIVKRLDPSTHGDLIAIGVSDNKIGLAISENDNSMFAVGDDLLRLGQDGIVRAISADQIVSNSDPKLRGAFGCHYDSVGSIFFGDGYATWVDINRHYHIKHDYNEARAVDLGKTHKWFKSRCQEIQTFNSTATDPLNKFRWVTGLNYQSGALMLTLKALRHSGFNNEDAPFLKPNETILYDPDADEYLSFCSFTAEGYGRLDLFDGAGCMFIAFLNGVPYIHPVIPDAFNEFFGVACDWKVGIVFNEAKEKLKRPLSMEVQSDTMFFAREVLTEKPNFKSEIPPVRWKRNQDKWNGGVLANINSRGGLYGDDKPVGYYTQVLLCRDNTDNLKYGTIDNAKRTAYSELDLVFFKAAILEQSGFTANV